MSSEPEPTKTEERDINAIFDDIVLAEDKLREAGYEEGYTEGRARGNQEGYQLGYAQGVQLGQELGSIYGRVVAEQQQQHTTKLQRTLEQLRKAIEEFPRENDAEKDIIGAVEHIRNLNKRLLAMLATKHAPKLDETVEERKDYTF